MRMFFKGKKKSRQTEPYAEEQFKNEADGDRTPNLWIDNSISVIWVALYVL